MQNTSDIDASTIPPVIPPFPPDIPATPEVRPARVGGLQHFRFHGTASEYFGIWIVNILLTIVTLGLYSPWAKVRRLRYFYGNTEFVQRRFDFTGVPVKILMGRLIALGLYFAISIASNLSTTATLVGLLILYLAVPWLIRATLRFNARNSKFGNARFYFGGTNKEAYWTFIKAILIYILTLGIFFPVLVWLYKRYCFDHLYAGQLKFKLNATWGDYMKAMYVPLFIFMGFLVAVMIFGIGSSFTNLGNPGVLSSLIGWIVAIYLFGFFIIFPLMQARIFITTWNNTSISRSQFKTDCTQWHYTWILVTNWIARILSLGLLTPWAAIRLYRYQVESLTLNLRNDPDMMMNRAQQDHSALAEEISDIFDIDVSL